MSKVVTSPVKRYPGTVVLSDPLTFPQSIAFEDALADAREAGETGSQTRIRYAMLPGILACVEAWHLDSFPAEVGVDNFPSSPRKPVADLIHWLITEITGLYQESETVPLA